MKAALCLVLSVLVVRRCEAQIAVNFSIPTKDSLLTQDASVIKDDENIELDITDVDRLTYTVHQIYTVLSDKGRAVLNFAQYTNKFISLEDADIEVYDADGKQIRKYRKKDMSTESTGEGLVEDGYVTYFRVAAPQYPVTVAYNYKLKYTGTVSYPSYQIVFPDESVVKSTFTARVSKGLGVRFKAKNIDLKPDVTTEDKFTRYQWQVSGLRAMKYEDGAPEYEACFPSVELAPDKFSYYHSEGDLSTWNEFGKWISGLYQGLDELPAEKVAFFRALVKDASGDREKASIVYDYLQKNFRYVSIQMGMGGIKPFSADYTDARKYGDCKGLANYMKAALKAVGVKSEVALVNAKYDSAPVDPLFPEMGFDHAILCIPEPDDSIWLECTSKTSDFGVLGSFTENRNALLITDDGGVLVRTPKGDSRENTLSIKTTTELASDGSGILHSALSASGSYREAMMSGFLNESTDDQKTFLVQVIGFKLPAAWQLEGLNAARPLTASLKMSYERIPDFMPGGKMFISPRPYQLWSYELPASGARRQPFYFPNPFVLTDTTVYQLPEAYEAGTLPPEEWLACPYARYASKCWFDKAAHTVYSVARLELIDNRIPAAQYASVKSFFDSVENVDNQELVIVKSE